MNPNTDPEELLEAIETHARTKIDALALELEHELALGEAELRYGTRST